jgi:hypothetical protein
VNSGLGDCEEHDDVKEAMGDLIGPIGDCGAFAGNNKGWACGELLWRRQRCGDG